MCGAELFVSHQNQFTLEQLLLGCLKLNDFLRVLLENLPHKNKSKLTCEYLGYGKFAVSLLWAASLPQTIINIAPPGWSFFV